MECYEKVIKCDKCGESTKQISESSFRRLKLPFCEKSEEIALDRAGNKVAGFNTSKYVNKTVDLCDSCYKHLGLWIAAFFTSDVSFDGSDIIFKN